jgi:hypothetical protein
MKSLTRTIHPEVRIVDEERGIVDYVASDETIDYYKEIIRASGWRFTNFKKNAPFVDSHDYSSIDKVLGKVIDFGIEKKRLVERVQWAIDVPENGLAQLGWKLTLGGYLKAVSVGFFPVKMVSKFGGDAAAWAAQLKELGLDSESPVRTIYLEQEQCELSACVIGANPNALAKACRDQFVDKDDLAFMGDGYTDFLERFRKFNARAAQLFSSKRPVSDEIELSCAPDFDDLESTARTANKRADAVGAERRGSGAFLTKFKNLIKDK